MDIADILSGLKIKADIDHIEQNDTTTKVYLRLHPGAKVRKIESCSTEIALGTHSYGKPIIRVLTEEGLVCIELLNNKVKQVSFGDFDRLFTSGGIREFGELPVVLGKTHNGGELVVDLAQMPHLLVAGSSGSGKSVLLHSIICSLIRDGAGIRLALIDPKGVEFAAYQNTRQLLYPVVSLPGDALEILDDLILEMDDRFKTFTDAKVTNIVSYNQRNDPVPYIVTVIDEFADLHRMFKKEFRNSVCTLAQKARAVGIHLVIATQYPVISVISGTIKANMPSRIALKTASANDSRVIMDCNGAEKLQGKGDAIINAGSLDMVRFQAAYIGMKDIETLCSQHERPKKAGFFDWLKG
jgi:S-DNA-T family DNA segregation ATPase FtsK/SpoIIIE